MSILDVLTKTLSETNLENVRLTRSELSKRAVLQGLSSDNLLVKPLEFSKRKRRVLSNLNVSSIPCINQDTLLLNGSSAVDTSQQIAHSLSPRSNTIPSTTDFSVDACVFYSNVINPLHSNKDSSDSDVSPAVKPVQDEEALNQVSVDTCTSTIDYNLDSTVRKSSIDHSDTDTKSSESVDHSLEDSIRISDNSVADSTPSETVLHNLLVSNVNVSKTVTFSADDTSSSLKSEKQTANLSIGSRIKNFFSRTFSTPTKVFNPVVKVEKQYPISAPSVPKFVTVLIPKLQTKSSSLPLQSTFHTNKNFVRQWSSAENVSRTSIDVTADDSTTLLLRDASLTLDIHANSNENLSSSSEDVIQNTESFTYHNTDYSWDDYHPALTFETSSTARPSCVSGARLDLNPSHLQSVHRTCKATTTRKLSCFDASDRDIYFDAVPSSRFSDSNDSLCNFTDTRINNTFDLEFNSELLDDILLDEEMSASGHQLLPFRGAYSENAELWLSNFELWAETQRNLTQRAKIAHFALHLRDAAKIWMSKFTIVDPPSSSDNSYSEHMVYHFGDIRQRFLERFRRPDDVAWQEVSSLYDRPQEVNESVEQYVNEMQRRGALCGANDEHIRFSILHGLKPSVKSVILNHDVTGIGNIVKWGITAEKIAETGSSATNDKRDKLEKMLHNMQEASEKNQCAQNASQSQDIVHPGVLPLANGRDYVTPQFSYTSPRGSEGASRARIFRGAQYSAGDAPAQYPEYESNPYATSPYQQNAQEYPPQFSANFGGPPQFQSYDGQRGVRFQGRRPNTQNTFRPPYQQRNFVPSYQQSTVGPNQGPY